MILQSREPPIAPQKPPLQILEPRPGLSPLPIGEATMLLQLQVRIVKSIRLKSLPRAITARPPA